MRTTHAQLLTRTQQPPATAAGGRVHGRACLRPSWLVRMHTPHTNTPRTHNSFPFPLNSLSHTHISPLLPPRPPSRADSRSTILHEHRRHLCRHHACTRQPLLAAVHKGKVSSSSTYTAAPLSPLTHSPLTTPLPTSNLQALSHTTEDTARRPLRCRSDPRYDRTIVSLLFSKPDRPIEQDTAR